MLPKNNSIAGRMKAKKLTSKLVQELQKKGRLDILIALVYVYVRLRRNRPTPVGNIRLKFLIF